MGRFLEGDLRNMPEDLALAEAAMDAALAGKIKMSRGGWIAFMIAFAVLVLLLLAIFIAGAGGIVLSIVYWDELWAFLEADKAGNPEIVFFILEFGCVMLIAISGFFGKIFLQKGFKILRMKPVVKK